MRCGASVGYGLTTFVVADVDGKERAHRDTRAGATNGRDRMNRIDRMNRMTSARDVSKQ